MGDNNSIKRELIFPYDLQYFAKDGPGGEKTEPATAKKLNDARKDGKVAKSKELNGALQLLCLFIMLKIMTGALGTDLISCFYDVYKKIPDIVNNSIGGMGVNSAQALINYSMQKILLTIWPILLVAFVLCALVDLVQVKWKPTAKPLQPKLSKLNPANGFKKIFSSQSIFELFKSFAKIGIVVLISYINIKDYADELFILYEISLNQAIALVGEIIIDTGLKIAIAFLILGLVDYIYSKHQFNEDMKMTKQEVKDEFKNSEGDPQIKGKQRQAMRQASQRRMMQDVPKADVVITNPTHYAVALQYDKEVATAPVVLAKGEDYMANKIKEKARESGVEIVENKPLARMLYANVDVGQQIPPELYQAVAEVLAEVFKRKNKSA